MHRFVNLIKFHSFVNLGKKHFLILFIYNPEHSCINCTDLGMAFNARICEFNKMSRFGEFL